MRCLLAATWLLGSIGCAAPDEVTSAWAVPLSARSPHPDDELLVATGLASPDRVEVAWGAYRAGSLGVTASADAVVGLLDDGPMMREAALDAIARLGLPVDPAKLQQLHERAQTQHDDTLAMTAMAVALRDPDRHRDLLVAAFDQALSGLDEGDWHSGHALTVWRAYANALAHLRDQQLVATLIGMLETDITVEVVSPGERYASGRCGGCGGYFSSSCMGVTTGMSLLPPRGVWRIDDADDAECVVLLPGPTDVCLARTEIGELVDSEDDYPNDDEPTEDQEQAIELVDEAEPWVDEPIDEARRAVCPDGLLDGDDAIDVASSARNGELLSYLSQLTGEEQHFDGLLSAVHVWRGEDHYREVVDGLHQRVRKDYARVLATAADAYLLPDGYQAPAIAITANVTDDRSCGVKAALPER